MSSTLTSADRAVQVILSFILIAIIVSALWTTFENSVVDLQNAWNASSFADVQQTLPGLAPLVPLLFGLTVVIGLIFAAIRIFRGD